MHIETPNRKLARNDKTVFEFLNKVENYELLMPDNIEKFEVLDEKTFKFALKGMPEIVLRLKEQEPYKTVVLGAASEKLPFTLTAVINALNEHESEVGLNFEGEFNAMMAMMIKGPITNFMGTLSENMGKIPQ
ncbi:SRPBCC family protein [Allomuricauda sp. d1]|uniref:SRPBCC family protein n=1 Tax=Allomuricauda sp. d1 TaxID=3136725 RepID=UPI0031E2495B